MFQNGRPILSNNTIQGKVNVLECPVQVFPYNRMLFSELSYISDWFGRVIDMRQI